MSSLRRDTRTPITFVADRLPDDDDQELVVAYPCTDGSWVAFVGRGDPGDDTNHLSDARKLARGEREAVMRDILAYVRE